MDRINLGEALQAAIYKTLSQHAGLEGALGGNKIYDIVPDEESFPYVVIGEEQLEEFDTHSFFGFKGTATIYIWDRQQSKQRLKQIMGLIYLALHDQDIGVANRAQLEFSCGRQSTDTEDDNRTHRGIMEFNFTFGGYSNE